MASNGMYIGNSERMTWIKCADVGVDRSPQLWSLEAPLMNGGLYARRSDNTHQTYQLTWTNISQQDKQEIEDFFYRVYGDGPYFFHLPGTFGNVLPRTFASPRLAATDGTSLIKHHRPRLMSMPDTNRYPTASAYYAVESEDEREEVGVVGGGWWRPPFSRGAARRPRQLVWRHAYGVQDGLPGRGSVSSGQAHEDPRGEGRPACAGERPCRRSDERAVGHARRYAPRVG